ncbi:CHAT domain-containing protein [Kitasatospora sp. NPDC008115]|uniref:CHAT domain-containing protein n=1 Tax=Kitasatospora sp. NPDC008115 TaxID=3364022 RepID=UPI0036ED9AB6
MPELNETIRATIGRTMAAPDAGVPYQVHPPEQVLDADLHRTMATLILDARDRLTPDQAGGPGGVDLELVFMVGCYYGARMQLLSEDEARWASYAFEFLLAVVRALRPEAVPTHWRQVFEERPPQLVPAYEVLHAVGTALFIPSEATGDEDGVLCATALLSTAWEWSRGTESEPVLGFKLGSFLATLADLDEDAESAGRNRVRSLQLMRGGLGAIPLDQSSLRATMMAEIIRVQAKVPAAAVPDDGVHAEIGRYNRDGDPARLDRIIDRLRVVVGGAAEPDRSHRRFELGQILRMRFEVKGDLDDLNESIDQLGTALAGPLDQEIRAGARSFLALSHLDRYVTSEDRADLDKATTLARLACDAATAASRAHGQRLTNLAAVLTMRAGTDDDPAALDEAIEHLRQAVAVTPPSQQDQPVMLIKLAVALRRRAGRPGREADLVTAETILRQVADQAADSGPHAQAARLELGELLAERGLRLRAGADLAEAVTHWRALALTPTQDVRSRLYGAVRWAMACANLDDLDQSRTAFGVALDDLLPKLTTRALGRDSQEARLRLTYTMANAAAATEIQAGRPRQALVRLEQGRGVLLAQALQLRGREDALRAVAPGLADRYEELCRELVEPRLDPERRRAAAEAFDRQVELIRRLPGMSGFHRPPNWSRLSEAAAQGPVVVLNVSVLRCDVLLLRSQRGRTVIEVLPLRDVTAEEVDRRADVFRAAVTGLTTRGAGLADKLRWHGDLEKTLHWLGASVVGPVLAKLGIDRPDGGGPLPRLWWCPTGALARLPLHAAVLPRTGDGPPSPPVYAHDLVVSSYVPTLGSLLHARERPAPAAGSGSLAAVAVDAGSGDRPLVGLDEELAATRRLPGPRRELRDAAATPGNVLAALRTHTHVHLACHGAWDGADPSNSRLLLHGGTLALRRLAAERLADAEFAYLSACHSAAPGAQLVNEAVSVASAFQLCGYRQVIGSLWTVDDAVAPRLAREVYRMLAEPGAPDPATVLHRAVDALRADPDFDEPLYWASMIHSGP